MVEKITEFFKNFPPKLCCDCGEILEEQHEAYLNHCNQCTTVLK